MATVLQTNTTPAAATQTLQSVIPGLNNLTGTASNNILNLLNGGASPSLARTTNAYWGVGAGAPAGGAGNTGDINSFIGRRGTDLYGQQSQQNQQTGLQNLLSLIGGTSGTLAPTPGQNQQNSQFYSNLNQQGSQFDQQQALADFQAQLQGLQIGGNIASQAQQNPFQI